MLATALLIALAGMSALLVDRHKTLIGTRYATARTPGGRGASVRIRTSFG